MFGNFSNTKIIRIETFQKLKVVLRIVYKFHNSYFVSFVIFNNDEKHHFQFFIFNIYKMPNSYFISFGIFVSFVIFEFLLQNDGRTLDARFCISPLEAKHPRTPCVVQGCYGMAAEARKRRPGAVHERAEAAVPWAAAVASS